MKNLLYIKKQQKKKTVNTCCKSQNDGHPANDVGPGETPVQEAFAKEGDSHSGVNCQRQQSKKTWEQRVRSPLSKKTRHMLDTPTYISGQHILKVHHILHFTAIIYHCMIQILDSNAGKRQP